MKSRKLENEEATKLTNKFMNSPLFLKLNADRRKARLAYEKKYGHDDGHRELDQCLRCKGKINPYAAFCKDCLEYHAKVGTKYTNNY